MNIRSTAQVSIRVLFLLALVAGVGLIAQVASARTDCDVRVDCSTHQILVRGRASLIDCGKPGHRTRNGVGRVGGFHSGRVVHNGIRIEGIPGMGDSGGGRVFHSVSWGPKGLNDSNGCIHVLPRVRDELHRCEGSHLSIVGADRSPRAPRGYRAPRHKYKRYYYDDEYGAPSSGGYSPDARE